MDALKKESSTKHANEVPVRGVVPIDQIFGDDEEDTRLLRAMASRAQEFILSFSWCKSIHAAYFGDGCGGVVALFLFRIEPSEANVDEWLWVVVGDLPPAYLIIDDCKTPSQALEGYIDEMSKWADLAKKGRTSTRVIPVNAPATPAYAVALEGRLKFLRDVMVPSFQTAETKRA